MSLALLRKEPLTLDKLTASDLFRVEQPRIALFGEFSAGKSSLANLLAGTDVLPTSILSSTRRLTRLHYADKTKITATNDQQVRVVVELSEITAEGGDDFLEIEVGVPCKRLRHLEIVDTPGFADPYQDPKRTLDVAEQANLGIWCTRANQAWRHSEWAVWADMPKRLHRSGLLVVTRCDSLANDADRKALLNRLRRETEGLFSGIVMLSIPEARRAQDGETGALDAVLWKQSGGEMLVTVLQNAVALIAADDDEPETPAPEPVNGRSDTYRASLEQSVANTPQRVDPEPQPEPDQAQSDLPSIDFPDLLDRMLQAMPACRFLAYVDLERARPLAVTVRERTATPPRMDDRLAVLAVDLFIGPASASMRRLAGQKNVRAAQEDTDVIREVTIEGGRINYVFVRRHDQPNHALIAISDKDQQPISLALATSRMALVRCIEEQRQSDEHRAPPDDYPAPSEVHPAASDEQPASLPDV